MLRADLQKLAVLRLRESRKLLDSGEYCGAYYLAGLSVECAIKAVIASRVQRYEFPDKDFARECYEHDPTKLIKAAGLIGQLAAEISAVPMFDANWAIVKDWKVNSRYDHSISSGQAQAIVKAVSARQYGVLRWLRQHW